MAGAFAELVRVSNGATLQPLDSDGLLGFVAQQGDKATVVAWATDGAVEAEWAAGAGSLLGATTTTAGGGTGIGTSPVMVEVPVEQASLLAGAG